MTNKLEEFLSLMESFPIGFAQPDNGIMPEDVMALAAEIRKKANMPNPSPADLGVVPMRKWRYQGICHGCAGPIFGLEPVED